MLNTVSVDTLTVPMIAMRGLVAFPGLPLHFEAGRLISVSAIEQAMKDDQLIFLVAQKDIREDEPEESGIYEVGCLCRIRQIFRPSEQSVKVLCEALYAATRSYTHKQNGYWICRIDPLPIKEAHHSENYQKALVRKIHNLFEQYNQLSSAPLSPDIFFSIMADDHLFSLSNAVAHSINAPVDDKQFILEQTEVTRRAKIVLELLTKECELLKIDNRISESVHRQMDENQREYYLREQIRAINEELYGVDDSDEPEMYYEKVSSLPAPPYIREKLCTEISKLVKMPQGSQEGTIVRNYLDTCLALPWQTSTKERTDLARAKRILDRDFYGMEKIKERILEMLSVYQRVPEAHGQILCFVGPPGIGKTSIAKTVSECMGRNYVRIALGGVHDEAEIRGHRRTYLGAMPGKILHAMETAKSENPLILLDEVDKLGNDYHGDPASALLEVLDSEQNATFTDHFLDMPYDLSRVVFLATANSLDTIPLPLLDRLEIIELSSYTREEKFHIARRHLVKKELAAHGLNASNCRITDSALYALIDYYTREAGVRSLERLIASLCRKSAKKLAEEKTDRIVIHEKDLVSYLGHRRFRPDELPSEDEVGVINGLAWTSVGGEMMQMEVAVVPGSGKLELTGSLGDIMQESAKAAVTYVRSCAENLGIEQDFYKTKDIHIHATEAAIPKDGPSAGVTMTTALVSALTKRPIRRDVAMTGEISIRGRVLPIGGLKEKSMAAYRSGIKKVFIPFDNVSDLDEVDEAVKKKIEFIPVKYEKEILNQALI